MEERVHVLLVDDEPAITENLAPFLTRAGFKVSIASDGQQALDFLTQSRPDLIVMDVLMPRLDGRETLRRIRQEGDWIPIILLTQVGESTERAMALEEGADDYLNKPFDPQELTARIKAVLRRVRPGERPLVSATMIICTGLRFDRSARRVFVDDQEVTPTPRALHLLEYMITHPDELVSRERLLDVVWGWDYPVGTRAVDTRIAELRRLLKDDAADPRFIETVPGLGYRFIAPVEGEA